MYFLFLSLLMHEFVLLRHYLVHRGLSKCSNKTLERETVDRELVEWGAEFSPAGSVVMASKSVLYSS